MHKDFFLLYDEYYPKLYAYFMVRVRHTETVEDIVQQTFEKALTHINDFRLKQGATFGSWLFAIAKNEFINVMRQRRGVVGVENDTLERLGTTESLLAVLVRHEDEQEEQKTWTEILSALDTLTTDEREVITLKYLAGMSYDDIGALMDKKPNTLAVLLKRSLEKIREKISLCKK